MSEFKYPMWFKSTDSKMVVKFTSIIEGEVVIPDLEKDEEANIGFLSDVWAEHTDSEVWENVTHLYQETVRDEKTSIPPLKLCGTTRPKVSHYQGEGIEPIDYINSHNFNFNLGNAIKYISRCGKKEGESTVKDLKKAIDYLNFEIERLNDEKS